MGTAIYARISQDRNDDAKGVQRQLEDCRRKVEGQVEEYVDNSKSAWKRGTKRPRYDALLAAVRAGRVDRIVVWHIDRLYRQMRELDTLLDLAEQGKVVVESIMGGDFDLSTADGAMRAQQMVMYATYESRHKGERVRRKQEENRKQGKSSGGRFAFGWTDAMTPDPVETKLILEAVHDLFAGASLKDIAWRWNKEGVKRPQNTESPWDANTIRLVVSNPRHAGLLAHDSKRGAGAYDRTVVGTAAWPAIIDRVRWEELMAFLNARGRSRAVPRRRSMLTGLLVCGRCGTTMVGSLAGSNKIFRCPSRRPELPNACGRVSVDATLVKAFLIEVALARADSGKLAAMVDVSVKDQQASKLVVQSLEALDQRLDAAGVMYASGKLNARAFQAASAKIEEEQARLRKELEDATSESVLSSFAAKKGLLRSSWETLAPDQQREVLSAILGKVEVMPTAVRGRHHFDENRFRFA